MNEDIIIQVPPRLKLFLHFGVYKHNHIASLVDVRLFYGHFSYFFKNLSKNSYHTARFLALQCLLEVKLLSLYQFYRTHIIIMLITCDYEQISP